MKYTLVLALLAGAASAADVTPLDVKTGEWEYTLTSQIQGLQAAKQIPQIPPDQLAKMPPEARARLEALMKQLGGAPTTTTSKTCVKKEDLAKLDPRGDDKRCKTTVISSSRSKQEIKFDCSASPTKEMGEMTMQALNSESVKFSFQGSASENGQPVTMNINGTGKWLSSTCTEDK